MLTPDRFRIFVRADVINVMFEWNRLLRQINLREPPRDPDWGTVSGQSWGRWEGDVLVVESRGFSRKRAIPKFSRGPGRRSSYTSGLPMNRSPKMFASIARRPVNCHCRNNRWCLFKRMSSQSFQE